MSPTLIHRLQLLAAAALFSTAGAAIKATTLSAWQVASFRSGIAALEASTLLLVEPALNPFWAWLVHGEVPGAWALAGGGVILAATLLKTWWGARPPLRAAGDGDRGPRVGERPARHSARSATEGSTRAARAAGRALARSATAPRSPTTPA
jgi:hypothetical protein